MRRETPSEKMSRSYTLCISGVRLMTIRRWAQPSGSVKRSDPRHVRAFLFYKFARVYLRGPAAHIRIPSSSVECKVTHTTRSFIELPLKSNEERK